MIALTPPMTPGFLAPFENEVLAPRAERPPPFPEHDEPSPAKPPRKRSTRAAKADQIYSGFWVLLRVLRFACELSTPSSSRFARSPGSFLQCGFEQREGRRSLQRIRADTIHPPPQPSS